MKVQKTKRLGGGGRLALLDVALAAVFCCSGGETTYPFSWYGGPTVANFPAPMVLRAGENGFSYDGFASADGADLRVKDASGNLLPHEIERWDATGDSLVWVKVPSLSSSAKVTLSWGDADAAASADIVWGDAYQVFHLDRANPRKNSSKYAITLTGTPDAVDTAPEGVGAAFTGDKNIGKKRMRTDAYPNTAIPSTDGTTAASFTISFWLKAYDFTTFGNYVWYLSGHNGQVDVLYNFDANHAKVVEIYGMGDTIRNASAIAVPDLRWHHYAYVYDAAKTTLSMYRDGVFVSSASKISFVFPKWTRGANAGILALGGGSGTANPLNGALDEFRFEPEARSASWIKACFASASAACKYEDGATHVLDVPEYDRATTLTDYPLMVTLDENLPGLSDAMRTALRNPGSVRFFTADGATELPYECESDSAETAAATYWVKMPSLAARSKLLLRGTAWPTVPTAYDTRVWSASHRHVWHLASTLYRYDSAPSGDLHFVTGDSFTNYAAAVAGPSGPYGAAQCGTNIKMTRGKSSDARELTTRYTVSFWARKDAADFAAPRSSYVFLMRRSSISRQIAVLTGFHGNGNTFKLWDSTGNVSSPLIDIPDADWHHYAFVADGATMKGYRDGAEVFSTATVFNFNMPSISDAWAFYMGGSASSPAANCFIGDLDEFRIENTPRSADWIYADFRTQRGRVHGVACLPSPQFASGVSAASSADGSLVFTADLVCKITSDVTFCYGAADGGTDAAAWDNAVSLGAAEAGALTHTLSALAEDQGVTGRFRAVNAYGEAWSAPIVGRAAAAPCGRYAQITVTNHVGAALADFPLCVRFPASLNLPADASGLRFLAADGRSLAFEIETWDPDGESVAWVKLPALAQGTKISAVWGRPFAARGGAHDTAVWAASDYAAVWHLASSADSSPHGRDFTVDTLSTAVSGVTGGARDFAGASGRHMTCADSHLLEDIAGAFTISGWIRRTTDLSNRYLLQIRNPTTGYHFALLYNFTGAAQGNAAGARDVQMYWSTSELSAYSSSASVRDQVPDLRYEVSPVTLPDDTDWHYFAYTCGQGTFTAYLDGEKVRERARNYSFGSGHTDRRTWTVELGQTMGGGSIFAGQLDELRFESVRRSDAWVRACYLNGKDALAVVQPAASCTVITLR